MADDSDCDDTDASVHPGATETCNGVDDDCDGTTDGADAAGASRWYADSDGDGYGDASTTTRDCSAPSGYVADDSDCDDTDASVHPGASESCNGVDDDCDGTTDEPSAVDAATWYRDADGDGYGSATAPTRTACSAPSGYVADDSDCDDADASVNPGAAEVCGNSVDDDCDGAVDESCPVEHCGAITADETWSASDEHLVTCTVYVQGSASPTLTIEDGATVEFDPGTGLVVAASNRGRLDVQGTSAGVTFTSSQASPSAGDWDGLVISAYDRGSTVEGLTLEYGGGNGRGGIYVYAASPTITASTIQDNAYSGIFVSSGSYPEITDTTITGNDDDGVTIQSGGGLATTGGPTFTGNAVTGNGGAALTLPPVAVEQLDASSSYAGNTEDAVVVRSGTLDQDATWQALDAPYRLSGDLYVQGTARPVWTLEDGVTVEVDVGAGVHVATGNYGSMDAQGTASGVTFTSAVGSPAPGDWDGISFGAYDDGSALTGTTVEYAGANGYGNLYLYFASPTLDGCTIQQSSWSGIYVGAGSFPAITDSTIQDNDDDGITVAASAGLATGATAGFTGNTLTGNAGHPISLPAAYAAQLDASSTYTGNDDDRVELLADTVDKDQTWQALDADYLVSGDVRVEGAARPQLTIEDGATLQLASGVDFYVGNGTYGSLSISATASGVTFTSDQGASAAPGDWGGLVFGAYDDGSSLDGVTVEYAGAAGFGAIYTYYASPTLSDCTVRYSAVDGIYVAAGAFPAISGCAIEDNDDDGVYVHSSGGLATSGGPTFTDNTITGNGGVPVSLTATYVGQLDASGTYTGNGTDEIVVRHATLNADATWQDLGVDYHVTADINVQGGANPQLTIEPGVTLAFDPGTGIIVGSSARGALYAVGTSSSPIVFTSSQAVPSRGDWDGITLGSYCDAANVFLQYLTVEYGGANGLGNVYWLYCDGTIWDASITDSSTWGMYRNGSAPDIVNVTYSNNAAGDLF